MAATSQVGVSFDVCEEAAAALAKLDLTNLSPLLVRYDIARETAYRIGEQLCSMGQEHREAMSADQLRELAEQLDALVTIAEEVEA